MGLQASLWDGCFNPASSCWKANIEAAARRSQCDRIGVNVKQTFYTLSDSVDKGGQSTLLTRISVTI